MLKIDAKGNVFSDSIVDLITTLKNIQSNVKEEDISFKASNPFFDYVANSYIFSNIKELEQVAMEYAQIEMYNKKDIIVTYKFEYKEKEIKLL